MTEIFFDFELVCLANQKIIIQPIKIEKKTNLIFKIIIVRS